MFPAGNCYTVRQSGSIIFLFMWHTYVCEKRSCSFFFLFFCLKTRCLFCLLQCFQEAKSFECLTIPHYDTQLEQIYNNSFLNCHPLPEPTLFVFLFFFTKISGSYRDELGLQRSKYTEWRQSNRKLHTTRWLGPKELTENLRKLRLTSRFDYCWRLFFH